ncbi:probable E3 SUMO-protein ligase RNF212 [Ursus maritimus]|uniref:Probable E3 SUMO-protein ligase RNF212 n=1 Tax=Ursus maritimus TaxID=29073 RepID=A0A8M1FG28_URSMA|nr:probable E3 SUMO-protein ligase RNF212 [Ursus maritimus]
MRQRKKAEGEAGKLRWCSGGPGPETPEKSRWEVSPELSGQAQPYRQQRLGRYLQGGKDVCLICKVPCCTVLLSKHTDADIQALFMGIDGLCKKYSRETCQISEFQEKHRKRLLAFYREKIAKLEESLQKSALRMEQLQSMRLSQQTAFSAVKTPVSTPSAKPGGHLLLPPDSSGSDRVESMQVDHTPSPMRKPEVAVGPARLSLISPPQHGRMGSLHRMWSSWPTVSSPVEASHCLALLHFWQHLPPWPSAPRPDAPSQQRVTGSQDPTAAGPLQGAVPGSGAPGPGPSGKTGLAQPQGLPDAGPQAAHQHLSTAAETAFRQVPGTRGPSARPAEAPQSGGQPCPPGPPPASLGPSLSLPPGRAPTLGKPGRNKQVHLNRSRLLAAWRHHDALRRRPSPWLRDRVSQLPHPARVVPVAAPAWSPPRTRQACQGSEDPHQSLQPCPVQLPHLTQHPKPWLKPHWHPDPALGQTRLVPQRRSSPARSMRSLSSATLQLLTDAFSSKRALKAVTLDPWAEGIRA